MFDHTRVENGIRLILFCLQFHPPVPDFAVSKWVLTTNVKQTTWNRNNIPTNLLVLQTLCVSKWKQLHFATTLICLHPPRHWGPGRAGWALISICLFTNPLSLVVINQKITYRKMFEQLPNKESEANKCSVSPGSVLFIPANATAKVTCSKVTHKPNMGLNTLNPKPVKNTNT